MAGNTTRADSKPVPTLNETYNGAPPRLQDEATEKRDKLAAMRTLPKNIQRKRGLQPPPGMTADVFLAAIDELRAELKDTDNTLIQVNGSGIDLVDGWYLDRPATTHDAFHIADPEALVSSASIYPRSTADVQTIVRWANRHLTKSGDRVRGIPLYPISLGRNLGYGGAAPRVPGGVVLDLGRNMHQILDLDGANASCVVEPGVSYFALYEAVQKLNNTKAHHPLWIDTPDLGGGSVLGNAVDRGVGYTPYGDHFGNHCGMEVVLPDGSLLRTGMGALPGPPNGTDNSETDNPAWQSFQHSFGPSIDGLFSQSSMGIVTKMGFQLMPAPPAHQSYCLTFPNEDDFSTIVEVIRPLAQRGVVGNIPQLRHVVQELNITGKPKSLFRGGDTANTSPLTSDEIHAAAKQLPLGDCAWVFYGTQYGTEQSTKDQIAEIEAAFKAVIPGTRLFLPKDVDPSHYLHDRALVCSGVPALRELDWLTWVPNGAHLFFSPIAPTRGKDAETLHNLIKQLHVEYGFDLFPSLCVAGREMHYISNIVYDRGDADAKQRAVRLMRAMIAACAAHGFGEYRTHLLFADQVARTYSWGGQALLKFHETVKDAFDPNGVLAPGRNGVWPRSYRGEGWELGVDDLSLDIIKPKAAKL
ncbi:aryl-alcohol oxidase vanillyl-alcohol oxidase [Ophiostoma piceae UAMH 11346]|uniref:Aryl-alcohol oxidase vanillyl-alcohol oxidase n=1 Tax=Ophiostoma piceae (strain UAMH 11346) TaxID=1262450 RepID=S3CD60_OPHP1|nr:aryl-alcohol oxidase vanillyl-alcohol oxidase [Ophiostoma piceae UAMH 11346]